MRNKNIQNHFRCVGHPLARIFLLLSLALPLFPAIASSAEEQEKSPVIEALKYDSLMSTSFELLNLHPGLKTGLRVAAISAGYSEYSLTPPKSYGSEISSGMAVGFKYSFLLSSAVLAGSLGLKYFFGLTFNSDPSFLGRPLPEEAKKLLIAAPFVLPVFVGIAGGISSGFEAAFLNFFHKRIYNKHQKKLENLKVSDSEDSDSEEIMVTS